MATLGPTQSLQPGDNDQNTTWSTLKSLATEAAKDTAGEASQTAKAALTMYEVAGDAREAETARAGLTAVGLGALDYAAGEVSGPLGVKDTYEAGSNFAAAAQTLYQGTDKDEPQDSALPPTKLLGGGASATGVLAPSGRVVSHNKARDARFFAGMTGAGGALSGATYGATTQGAKDAASGAAVDLVTGGGSMGAAAAGGLVTGATRGAIAGGAEGLAQGTEAGMATAQQGLISRGGLRSSVFRLRDLFRDRDKQKERVTTLQATPPKKGLSKKRQKAEGQLAQTQHSLELTTDQMDKLQRFSGMKRAGQAVKDTAASTMGWFGFGGGQEVTPSSQTPSFADDTGLPPRKSADLDFDRPVAEPWKQAPTPTSQGSKKGRRRNRK